MNKNEPIEQVRAEKYNVPYAVWEFTPLDKACYKMVIRGTWVYDKHLDTEQLKKSLSKLLSYYPHLAGRMKDDRGIALTNEGVSFTVSDRPDLPIAKVLKREDLLTIKECTMDIKPIRLRKGLIAPLSVKLTRLKNGSVLGIQCSHACMDGDSFYTMVYNWGQIYKNEFFDEPVLDQSLLPIPEDTTADKIKAAALEAGWKTLSIFSIIKLLPVIASGVIKKRSRPFYISAKTISCLKKQIANTTGISCSSNVVLSALISKRCIDLYNHSENTRCIVINVINTRQRLAGIPSTYAGNSSLSIATSAFPVEADIDQIASIIHHTLEPVRKSPSPTLQKLMQLNLYVMKHKLPLAPFDILGMYAKKPTIMYLNNFSKLHIYDIDFGQGKPIRVIPHDLHDQIVIWPTPSATGGIEVYFSGIPVHYVNLLENNFFDQF